MAGDGSAHPAPQIPSKSTGAGRPLPERTRAQMERAFGHDFSRIRIHEGEHPRAVGALAYTQGEHIHFSPGTYRPHSIAGRRILGHELTHVVQQRGGRVAIPQGGGAPVNADARLEAEADRLGSRVATGASVLSPQALSAPGKPHPLVAPIQRYCWMCLGKCTNPKAHADYQDPGGPHTSKTPAPKKPSGRGSANAAAAASQSPSSASGDRSASRLASNIPEKRKAKVRSETPPSTASGNARAASPPSADGGPTLSPRSTTVKKKLRTAAYSGNGSSSAAAAAGGGGTDFSPPASNASPGLSLPPLASISADAAVADMSALSAVPAGPRRRREYVPPPPRSLADLAGVPTAPSPRKHSPPASPASAVAGKPAPSPNTVTSALTSANAEALAMDDVSPAAASEPASAESAKERSKREKVAPIRARPPVSPEMSGGGGAAAASASSSGSSLPALKPGKPPASVSPAQAEQLKDFIRPDLNRTKFVQKGGFNKEIGYEPREARSYAGDREPQTWKHFGTAALAATAEADKPLNEAAKAAAIAKAKAAEKAAAKAKAKAAAKAPASAAGNTAAEPAAASAKKKPVPYKKQPAPVEMQGELGLNANAIASTNDEAASKRFTERVTAAGGVQNFLEQHKPSGQPDRRVKMSRAKFLGGSDARAAAWANNPNQAARNPADEANAQAIHQTLLNADAAHYVDQSDPKAVQAAHKRLQEETGLLMVVSGKKHAELNVADFNARIGVPPASTRIAGPKRPCATCHAELEAKKIKPTSKRGLLILEQCECASAASAKNIKRDWKDQRNKPAVTVNAETGKDDPTAGTDSDTDEEGNVVPTARRVAPGTGAASARSKKPKAKPAAAAAAAAASSSSQQRTLDKFLTPKAARDSASPPASRAPSSDADDLDLVGMPKKTSPSKKVVASASSPLRPVATGDADATKAKAAKTVTVTSPSAINSAARKPDKTSASASAGGGFGGGGGAPMPVPMPMPVAMKEPGAAASDAEHAAYRRYRDAGGPLHPDDQARRDRERLNRKEESDRKAREAERAKSKSHKSDDDDWMRDVGDD